MIFSNTRTHTHALQYDYDSKYSFHCTCKSFFIITT